MTAGRTCALLQSISGSVQMQRQRLIDASVVERSLQIGTVIAPTE